MKALIALLVALPLAATSLTGCTDKKEDQTVQENMEDAGESVEETMEDAGDTMEDAGEEVSDEAEDAVE